MKQLQGLLAFVEAATAGSLRAAADRLELTPAAVSKSLARLEAQLGVRLLHRSTRRLALTDEGTRFLAKARDALRALDDAVAEVSQSAAAPAGRVRISAGAAFARAWVLPLLPKLLVAHPALAIELDFDNRPVDLAAEGFDIGIRGGHIVDSSLVARRVCKLPLVLVATPGYLRRAGVPAAAADLAQHRLIAVRLGSTVNPWRFRRGGGARTLVVAPDERLVVTDPEAAQVLALADGGIAQVGLYHCLPYLRSGRLKLVLPDSHDPGAREFVLHYPHRQFLAPRVRVVVEALLAHLREASDLHLSVPDLIAALPQVVATPAGVVAATRGRAPPS